MPESFVVFFIQKTDIWTKCTKYNHREAHTHTHTGDLIGLFLNKFFLIFLSFRCSCRHVTTANFFFHAEQRKWLQYHKQKFLFVYRKRERQYSHVTLCDQFQSDIPSSLCDKKSTQPQLAMPPVPTGSKGGFNQETKRLIPCVRECHFLLSTDPNSL